ncbi:tyrosine recombinase XerC [Candidatus Liberibacter americanus]|uniref:Integrase n=1 Tax=Candidatus Liberibacter americanus str. Sao Paulo TaxID=1261131 RepID=U6B4P9_9HYPH|nr:tyrosine recombinase XerC [Candidatus Liberibacter americanus]AHA27870.1 Integrase [Candidatus Liberibacter americanus str. Sao Paulo]EMS35913.1 site-specific tyrosine recombinase XerC [Candidatus Liberibacter americanus PW_SP]
MAKDKLDKIIKPNLLDKHKNWLEYLRIEKGLSKTTLNAYERDTRQFFAFISFYNNGNAVDFQTIRKLIYADIRAFIAKRRQNNIENQSIQRSISGIKSFFKYLKKNNIADLTNIIDMKSLKKSIRLPKPLSEKQAIKLMNYNLNSHCWLKARNSAILYLLYGCGLRISEALSIKPKSIINDQSSLLIKGKGNKKRIIPMLPSVKKALTKYIMMCPFNLDKDTPLFRGTRGKTLNQGVFQRNIRDIRQQIGLPESTTPHTLRHSFATHLLSNGADLSSIQKILGHEKLSTTQIYTNIDSKKILEIYDKTHPIFNMENSKDD